MPRSQENAAPQTVLGAHALRRAEATADSPQTITQVKLRALLCRSNTLKKGVEFSRTPRKWALLGQQLMDTSLWKSKGSSEGDGRISLSHLKVCTPITMYKTRMEILASLKLVLVSWQCPCVTKRLDMPFPFSKWHVSHQYGDQGGNGCSFSVEDQSRMDSHFPG